MSITSLLFNTLILLILASCNDSSVNNHPTRDENKTGSSINRDDFEVKDTIDILVDLIKVNFPSYVLFEHQYGDINGDGNIDAVIVVEKECGEEDNFASNESKCRKVILLLNKGFPKFEASSENDKLIGCSDCGGGGIGDPFRGITIKNGYISFESVFGSCDKTFQVITFKYNPAKSDWYLYKMRTEDYSCKNEENEEVKVVSKTKTTDDFGIITFSEYSD